MTQEIKYNGITTNPSDYESPDGDLALCSNLLNEDGRLQPLPQPSIIMNLSNGFKVVFIHRTAAFKHYIIANSDNTTLSWQSDSDNTPSSFWQAPDGITVLNLAAIGNTLVLTASDGIHYFLWKSNANNPRYLYLGQKPPELQLQFGVSEDKRDTVGEIDNITYSTTYKWYAKSTTFPVDNIMEEDSQRFKSEYRGNITNLLWSLINPVTAKVTEKNLFYAPFFVRYCYRLFDGSYVMHSAPVFIPLSSPQTYNLGTHASSGDDDFLLGFLFKPSAVALQFQCSQQEILQQLSTNWSDIVQSIDIFVSLPITPENNQKNIESVSEKPFVRYSDNRIHSDEFPLSYRLSPDIPMLFTLDEEYLDHIKSVSNFFKISSYDINDFVADSSFHDVNIRSGILSTLATQEAMTDDYKTHNSLIPASGYSPSSFIYNRRLNLAGFAEKLFDGFCVNSMLPYVTPDASSPHKVFAIAVTINTEEGEKTVVHLHPDGADFSPLLLLNNPLFYPDNRANRMDIYCDYDNGQYRRYSFSMKPCPLLNGAFTKGGIIRSTVTPIPVLQDIAIPSPDNTVNVAHKIYTSEVNNPFFFPVTGINSVGSGSVLGLAAATKALSEGQFGQFPLYAFTTEGIWALSVNSSGGYSASNPVSRDVCINPHSITPIDNAILFASSRGIMLLQGSNTLCISDRIKDYPNPSIPSSLSTPSLIPFSDFLTHCRMAYDYTHQRVHLFNPSCNYAYIYALKSGLWSMADSNLVSVVNDYPDTLAMTDSGSLISLSQPQLVNSDGNPATVSCYYVTRPLKLGAPNTLKTALNIIQHGMFQRGDIKTILYGSRDLFHWHLIASSSSHELRHLHGSPYKYFRIVSIATLTPQKSLFGATFEFTPRHTTTLQ